MSRKLTDEQLDQVVAFMEKEGIFSFIDNFNLRKFNLFGIKSQLNDEYMAELGTAVIDEVASWLGFDKGNDIYEKKISSLSEEIDDFDPTKETVILDNGHLPVVAKKLMEKYPNMKITIYGPNLIWDDDRLRSEGLLSENVRVVREKFSTKTEFTSGSNFVYYGGYSTICNGTPVLESQDNMVVLSETEIKHLGRLVYDASKEEKRNRVIAILRELYPNESASFIDAYEQNYSVDRLNLIRSILHLPEECCSDMNIDKLVDGIIEEFGEDKLKSVNIVEVSSGELPALSLRLMEKVPGISHVTVYDPKLAVNEENKYSKIALIKESPAIKDIVLIDRKFTPKDIDSSRPTLIISRHPCEGTPAIVEAAGKKRGVELYALLCRCSDADMISRGVITEQDLESFDAFKKTKKVTFPNNWISSDLLYTTRWVRHFKLKLVKDIRKLGKTSNVNSSIFRDDARLIIVKEDESRKSK